MTDLLEKAVAAVRRMPPDEQDSIAETMLRLARTADPVAIDPEHREAVLEGLAQAARGDFAEGSASEIVARAFERART